MTPLLAAALHVGANLEGSTSFLFPGGAPMKPQIRLPPFWCEVCSKDLQSAKALSEHDGGRKHLKRAFRSGAVSIVATSASVPPAVPWGHIEEAEIFEGLASGTYRNVVVLTGAGASTAAGIPDFRSPGVGLFDAIRARFGDRYPETWDCPEHILSRSFAAANTEIWEREVLPMTRLMHAGGNSGGIRFEPTRAHRFCAWLHRRGALRRVYTQNVDGLHTHSSLGMPEEAVVECHGATRDGSLVLYGDPLPKRFYDCCDLDFPTTTSGRGGKVDLLLTFGSSLQVAPFCAVPNMTPRGSVRVLVNRSLRDCLRNEFCTPLGASRRYGMVNTHRARIGSRKDVPLRSMWTGREGNKKWRQLLVEEDCDAFVDRFFGSSHAVERGLGLDVAE